MSLKLGNTLVAGIPILKNELPSQTGQSGKFLTTNGTAVSWESITIPTVNDSTIIISQGGVEKGRFSLNQATGDTITLDAGGSDPLPSQTGHAGEFLTTNGTIASWANIPEELPAQSGQSGKFLTTNGTTVSWASVTADTEVEWGEYNVTTYQQVKNWYDAGKIIFIKYPVSNTFTRIFKLENHQNNETNSYFSFNCLQDKQNFIITLNSSTGWSSTDRTYQDRIPAGTAGNIITYSGTAGTVGSATINDIVPSQSGQSGKFLTTNGTAVSWASVPSNLPSQTGQSGKFLTTNGTDASWGDALINNTTKSSSLAIIGSVTDVMGTAVGVSSSAAGYGTAIGYNTSTTKIGGVAIGAYAQSTAIGAIQISSVGNSNVSAINNDPGTLYVALYSAGGTGTSGNYKLLGCDGIIPQARLASGGTNGQVLTTNGTTASWTTLNALQNIATGTDSLTILGTPASSIDAVNIGSGSKAGRSSVIIGYNSTSGDLGSYGVAIGYESEASANVGYCVAIGGNAKSKAIHAIQLGYGTNTEANSLYVSTSTSNNWKLLGSDGKIPDDRLNTTIARTSQIPTVDQTYSGTSTNAQSGVAVKSAIDAAISSVYKPAGSTTFANKPSLSSSIEGYVYNVSDAFTTTSDFVEGAGKSYPAGTNIVCINTATSGTAVYKWDVLAGFVDLSGYQTLIDSTHKLSADLVDDTSTTHKFVSSSDITNWNGKVDANTSITGATKCKITYDSKGLVTAGADLTASDIPDISATYQTKLSSTNKLNADYITDGTINNTVTATEKSTWSGKQDALVSGTNIKTINSTSLLGSGNITIDSLPSQTSQSGKFLTTNGTTASWAAINALQNTATGTNSLTILGTAATLTQSVNIGPFSSASGSGGVSVGYNASTSSSVAIGNNSSANYPNTVAIGNGAIVSASGGIQLGSGTASDDSLYVGLGYITHTNYKLLGSDGIIPQSRLASGGTNGQVLTTNGTTASWSDVPTEIPSQSGQSGKYLTTNGTVVSWADVDALPSQTGQSGKFLTTNGSAASWEEVPSSTTITYWDE